jgi:hypothetical protein
MDGENRFGQLERVEARTGWPGGESGDFTPWLAMNLDALAGELGLALELKAREYRIGRYYLDLLLEDARGRVVIVENQFNTTDHDHLGKLLTYCAGTNAQVVIWIAESLNEEHVAALEWLNENTLTDVGFFGVEVELLRIGDSLPAPHFRVIVRPNETKKEQERATREQLEWNWEAYADKLNLPQDRIAVARALVNEIEAEIAERELPWQRVFRKGYVPFQRSSGYNVIVVDIWARRNTVLALKLPAPPEELGLIDPYPALESLWDANNNQWSWLVPHPDATPDVRPVLELAQRFHPASGPMVVPTEASRVQSAVEHGDESG